MQQATSHVNERAPSRVALEVSRILGLLLRLICGAALLSGAAASAQPAGGGKRIVDWKAGAGSAANSGWKMERFGTLREATMAADTATDGKGATLRVNLSSSDDKPPPAALTYFVDFQAGHAYRVTLDISATQSVNADVFIRRKAAPYDAMAVRSVALTPAWQAVTFEAAWPFDVPSGDIRVGISQPSAQVLMRHLTVDDLGPLPLGSAQSKPFPPTMIGIHVNKLGQHKTWPRVGQGLIRLWDTRTTWKDLAPTPEAFDSFSSDGWKRLDLYVNYAKSNDPNVAVLYTLGQPPRWASGSPDAQCAYGIGTCGAPATMDLWRHYVRTLAQRYKGRIQYWELWNEPNYKAFFVPTMSLVELAKAAREELKAVDPANKLIGPGFTNFGLRPLHEFLRDGGGQYVDAMAFHWYFDGQPEKLAPAIYNVRQVMKANGAGNLPLWDTEGSPICQGRREGACNLNGLSADEQDAVVARAIITMWLNGMEAFAYYFAEGMDGRSIALMVAGDATLTRSGQQLAMLSNWMLGATASAVTTWGQAGHAVQLRRANRDVTIVWSSVDGDAFPLPRDGTVKSKQTLGEAAASPVTGSATLAVGRTPILLSP